MVKVLVAYRDWHGINTISGIINRWAPSADHNDTAAYIADVCARADIGKNDVLDLKNYPLMYKIVEAIIWHENGQQPYDEAELQNVVDKNLL